MSQGGSLLIEMMRHSTLALEQKYVAAGQVTPENLVRYVEFESSLDCWATYYAAVKSLARK